MSQVYKLLEKTDWRDFDTIVLAELINKIETHIYTARRTVDKLNTKLTAMGNDNTQIQTQIETLQTTITTLQAQIDPIFKCVERIFASYKGKALISLMDDDISQDFITQSYDLYEQNNLKCTLSAPIDLVDITSYMTLPKLLELKGKGYEIMNHIKGGYTLSPTNSAALITRCKQFGINYGLFSASSINAQALVYPNANIDPDPEAVRQECAKFVTYGLDVGGTTMRPANIEKLKMSRLYLCKATGVGTWFDDILMDSMGFYKKWVDVFDETGKWLYGHMVVTYDASIIKGWNIMFTHSWMRDEAKYGDNIFVKEKLASMMSYIKAGHQDDDKTTTQYLKHVTVPQGLMIWFGVPPIGNS